MKILIIISTILLISCNSSKDTTKKATVGNKGENVEFTIIKEGTNNGYKELGNGYAILYRQNGFNMIWDSIFSNYMKKPSIPEIDFETKQLILVGMGEKPNGGYSIKIESISETKKEIIINIIESKPGNTCMTPSVVSYPYQLIEIPKTNKKFILNRVEKIYECEK